jgi:hypothetical protein
VTPGQFRWLSKLAAHGPKARPRHGSYPMLTCNRKGWTEFVADHTEKITQKGRDALNVALAQDNRCQCCGNFY